MNNKGFAITTILFGLFILFCMLLLSLFGIFSYNNRIYDMLLNNSNGTMNIAEIEKDEDKPVGYVVTKRGLYCVGSSCKYYKKGDTVSY